MNIRITALLAVSGLALSACAANPGPVIDTSTKKLISYFDAKKELASTLQQQLGGPSVPSASERTSYRLVALNGPAYQIGSVLSARNVLDLMTRRCTFLPDELPIEPWSTMPRWSSNSNLNTSLGVPAPIRGVFDQTSVDAGLNFQSASIYAIEDIAQRFLARDELKDLTESGECGEFFSELNEPVYFVRGIVYGRETLKSAKGFEAGLNVRVIEEDSGQFTFKYDRNGAYELTDADVVPKFAIIAKFVPLMEPEPMLEVAGAVAMPPAPIPTRPRTRVEETASPSPIPEDRLLSAELESIEPAAGPRNQNFGLTPEAISDEEVAELERMLAGGGD